MPLSAGLSAVAPAFVVGGIICGALIPIGAPPAASWPLGAAKMGVPAPPGGGPPGCPGYPAIIPGAIPFCSRSLRIHSTRPSVNAGVEPSGATCCGTGAAARDAAGISGADAGTAGAAGAAGSGGVGGGYASGASSSSAAAVASMSSPPPMSMSSNRRLGDGVGDGRAAAAGSAAGGGTGPAHGGGGAAVDDAASPEDEGPPAPNCGGGADDGPAPGVVPSGPTSSGATPPAMHMSISADCAWARCSASTTAWASASATVGFAPTFVRCRLFWNHTWTWRCRTPSRDASCSRSSRPGHFSSAKTRSSRSTSSGSSTQRGGGLSLSATDVIEVFGPDHGAHELCPALGLFSNLAIANWARLQSSGRRGPGGSPPRRWPPPSPSFVSGRNFVFRLTPYPPSKRPSTAANRVASAAKKRSAPNRMHHSR